MKHPECDGVDGMKSAVSSEWVVLPLTVACFWPGAATQTFTSTTQTTVTSTVPPYQYFQGDWSACSATCAVGTRTREVFCYETCSVPKFCTVEEERCAGVSKPLSFDYCWPPVASCPDSTTISATTSLTSTRSTNTQTATSRTTTQGVRAGWLCVHEASTGCVAGSIAQVQCGSSCPCCKRSGIQSTTPRPFQPSDGGNEVSAAVVVTVTLTSVALVSGFAFAGWRSCSKSRRKLHAGTQIPKAEAYGRADSRHTDPRRVKADAGQEEAVYDRKLGKGIPSAAPDGFFDGPPDWMNDEEDGTSSPSRSHPAKENMFTRSEDKARSTQSSPMRKGRFIPAAGKDESDEHEESPRATPTSPSGTLPPGYAAAARRNRRTGKEAPDVDSFATDSHHVPGQANASPRQSHSKSKASQPGKEEKENDGDGHEKPHQAGPRAAGRSEDDPGRKSRTGASGSTRGDERANPRVAANTAAAPEAADLIAKVDKELDQTQSKDLETRRRTFKNLILKWHPDKNQEEVLAAEVFRHLMSRRGRYLEA
mmetsp:Transcript_117126/g.164701  ORF Transcript_117126/g.164701 Transcript_117126/m.164701 type:complete len:537 (-) Transcript_117126:193-1803(-)